jgi:hypothetical protein
MENAAENEVNKINGIIFATHFTSFVKQSVRGAIVAAYIFHTTSNNSIVDLAKPTLEELIKNIHNEKLISTNLISYLNTSWHSYNNKTDQYIIQKVDFMMKGGKFSHLSCLFEFIKDFAQTILLYTLGRIEEKELAKDSEFLREALDIILDATLSTHVENLISIDSLCEEKCTYKIYDCTDLFDKIY